MGGGAGGLKWAVLLVVDDIDADGDKVLEIGLFEAGCAARSTESEVGVVFRSGASTMQRVKSLRVLCSGAGSLHI